MSSVICGECGSPCVLADSTVVYRGRSRGKIWICSRYPSCDSYVGVHSNSRRHAPKGVPAGPYTRRARGELHRFFDWLWKEGIIDELMPGTKRGNRRRKAYLWLSRVLGIPEGDCHISYWHGDRCYEVLEIITKKLEESGHIRKRSRPYARKNTGRRTDGD